MPGNKYDRLKTFSSVFL